MLIIEFLHPHLQSEVIFANIQFTHHQDFMEISTFLDMERNDFSRVSLRAANIKRNNGSKLPDTYDHLFTLIRVDIWRNPVSFSLNVYYCRLSLQQWWLLVVKTCSIWTFALNRVPLISWAPARGSNTLAINWRGRKLLLKDRWLRVWSC